MSSMALDVAGFEAGMLQRAEDATSIGTAFEVVRNGAVALFCSDCCGSNGNDCVPEIDPGIN
ncbi:MULTISPECIES: hypothetical protein [Stenotrophomonas]|jgi:hypothetical protein|nr:MULTISPECIES: hypothetical protein [Stenotrophomonas]UUS14570.1 hypothetical protein NMB32_24020 [Stenotrophomonas sp. CD2]ELF4099643.1 hypothetical protein [Stenotrophomonas maltophilia]MBH1618867.1 hypothetical protein [Stenotrophomonas maltophilia]MBH1629323.1 hypothetical protein [Stenotrophomonas maltophilia]MBN5021552.1 hypothetical protein [Stenotrophomonas maltophilia]